MEARRSMKARNVMKPLLIAAAIAGAVMCGIAAPAAPVTPAADVVASATVERFVGDWQGQSSAAATVQQAIERATAPMNMFIRGTARGRLAKTNEPPARIHMRREGDALRIQFDDRPAMVLPLAGTPVQDGERTLRLQPEGDAGDALRQTGETKEGQRVNVYRLGASHANGMTMSVTVSSPRLPSPITYTLAFTRASRAE